MLGGLNTYGYVGGNPLSAIDPFGLEFADQFFMTFDWLFGRGLDNRQFGEFSDQVADLKGLPAVDGARDLFRQKNRDRQCSSECNEEEFELVTNYRSSFGLSGYASATKEMNSTWHFVGSFAIEIFPSKDCKRMEFVLKNTSSFTSLMYGIAPNWERSSFGPMGNMRQTYTWTEAF